MTFLCASFGLVPSALAEPMNLADATPRWVAVQFESSPHDRPGLLDDSYSPHFPAWLEPDADGNIVLRVDGEVVEQTAFRGQHPVSGSFSDYVWVFEPHTGSVLSASFDGIVMHEISLGFTSTWIEAHVAASMSTTRRAGYMGLSRIWGNRVHRYCEEPRHRRCTMVESTRYDAVRGYVNAIGHLEVRASVVRFSTFSALGEARWSELGAARGPTGWSANLEASTQPERAQSYATSRSDSPVRETQVGAAIDVSAPPPMN